MVEDFYKGLEQEPRPNKTQYTRIPRCQEAQTLLGLDGCKFGVEVMLWAFPKTEPQGSHSIDGSADKQWEIGEGFMQLDNMFLVQLEPVARASFQPEIWVIDRTM